MRRLSVVLAIIASLVLVSTTFADSSKPKLSFVKDGHGTTIGWSNEGGSSPAGGGSNTNTQSLRINVTVDTSPTVIAGASAYTYGADEVLVGIRGLPFASIDRLGFDSKGYLGVRISLGTTGTDGEHTYFLQASSCNVSIGNGWFTSDFINGGPTCFVFRDNDPTGRPWTLWVPVATANNEVVASSPSDWFLIVDQGPTLTYVDRLTIQDWCWTGGGNGGIINANSGDCVGN